MDEKKPKAARESLTKGQLEGPEAIEFLALLQTVTEDGRILDEEVAALNEWLSHNRDSAITGVVYLRESVEAVLEDGRVSEAERAWLQTAIETVMPQEERSVATMRRREAKADDRAAQAEATADAREQAKKDRPINRFDFMVAGAQHEGRAVVIQAHCQVVDDVFLVREPNNKFSRHAILCGSRMEWISATSPRPMLSASLPSLMKAPAILPASRRFSRAERHRSR